MNYTEAGELISARRTLLMKGAYLIPPTDGSFPRQEYESEFEFRARWTQAVRESMEPYLERYVLSLIDPIIERYKWRPKHLRRHGIIRP